MAEHDSKEYEPRSIDVSNDTTVRRDPDGWVWVETGEGAAELAPVEVSEVARVLERVDPHGDDPSETVVVVGPHGWGKGAHETEALANAAPHINLGDDGTTKVWLAHCVGYEGHRVGPRGFEVEADEVTKEKHLKVSNDDLRKVADLSGDLEIAAEAALVDAVDAGDEADD